MASTSIPFIAPGVRRRRCGGHGVNILLSLLLLGLAAPWVRAQPATRLQTVASLHQASVCIDVPNPSGGTERLGCNPDVHDLNVDAQAGAPLVTAGSVRWQEQTDQQPGTTDSYRIDIQSSWQISHYHSIDSAGPDGFGRLSAGGYASSSMNGSLLDGSNQPAGNSLVTHKMYNASSFEFDLAGDVEVRLSGSTSGTDGVSLSYLQLFRCQISCSEFIPAFMVSEAETTNTSFEMAGQLRRGQYVLYALSFGSRAQATPGSSLAASWDFLLEFDNVSAPVPEPAPAALALAGLALLVMRRRGFAG